MAGVPRFELGNGGIKTRCLTAWRYPSNGAEGETRTLTPKYWNLNPARLPISPLPLKMVATAGIEPATPAL